MKRTRLKSGTPYPLLARLENVGWVESDWETQTEPGFWRDVHDTVRDTKME